MLGLRPSFTASRFGLQMECYFCEKRKMFSFFRELELFFCWREGANIPCGEGEMFIFSEREGNVLLVGVRNVFLAGEKRVKSLVEMEKCSFFQ